MTRIFSVMIVPPEPHVLRCKSWLWVGLHQLPRQQKVEKISSDTVVDYLILSPLLRENFHTHFCSLYAMCYLLQIEMYICFLKKKKLDFLVTLQVSQREFFPFRSWRHNISAPIRIGWLQEASPTCNINDWRCTHTHAHTHPRTHAHTHARINMHARTCVHTMCDYV